MQRTWRFPPWCCHHSTATTEGAFGGSLRRGRLVPGRLSLLCTRPVFSFSSRLPACVRACVFLPVSPPIRWNVCALLMVIQQPFLSPSTHPADAERRLVKLRFLPMLQPFGLSARVLAWDFLHRRRSNDTQPLSFTQDKARDLIS